MRSTQGLQAHYRGCLRRLGGHADGSDMGRAVCSTAAPAFPGYQLERLSVDHACRRHCPGAWIAVVLQINLAFSMDTAGRLSAMNSEKSPAIHILGICGTFMGG